MEGLILRFDAPLMSFGGVKIDQHNITDRFPGLSMLAGLLANALGWSHSESQKIQNLQDRLIVASRWDIYPEPVIDYHTVDLGQPKMCEKGWTTRGVPEHRDGGPGAKFGIHQRWRHYLANGVLTLALALMGEDAPQIMDIEKALRQPVRPLFFGRKTCLPSAPILLGRTKGDNVLTMLKTTPQATCAVRISGKRMVARWPAELGVGHPDQMKPSYDLRDWTSQLHTGNRLVVEGEIEEITDVHD